MQDLANFTPFPDEWSVEDKVLFEQAFQVFKAQSFFMIMWFLYVRPDYLIYSRTFFYDLCYNQTFFMLFGEIYGNIDYQIFILVPR